MCWGMAAGCLSTAAANDTGIWIYCGASIIRRWWAIQNNTRWRHCGSLWPMRWWGNT